MAKYGKQRQGWKEGQTRVITGRLLVLARYGKQWQSALGCRSMAVTSHHP